MLLLLLPPINRQDVGDVTIVEPKPGRVNQDGPVVGVAVLKRGWWNGRHRIVQRQNFYDVKQNYDEKHQCLHGKIRLLNSKARNFLSNFLFFIIFFNVNKISWFAANWMYN